MTSNLKWIDSESDGETTNETEAPRKKTNFEDAKMHKKNKIETFPNLEALKKVKICTEQL